MNKGCRPDPKTMPVTREYAEGHERTFGKSERKTGRWFFNPKTKQMEEIGANWEPTNARNVGRHGDFYMDGAHTVDGVDIGSRRKRNDYKRAAGVEDSSDFKNTIAEQTKIREAFFTSGGDWREHKERREDIGRAAYEVQTQARRRR